MRHFTCVKDLGDLKEALNEAFEIKKDRFQFSELEAPQLPRSLQDADAAVININFALEAKLDPKTAIYTESKDSPYANIVAVREGDEKRPEIQKLVKALHSEKVKKLLDEKYKGAIIPSFN